MWRINQFQKEICPYCFEYFYIKDTPFRCASPPDKCTPEPDAVYKKAWGESLPPMGKVLEPKDNFKDQFNKFIRCESCGHDSHKRLCPHCHSELPHTTGQFKNYIFAIIGAKEAGKSHYIAVLINQIKKQFGPTMGMLLEPMGDGTIKRYRKEFYDPVYNDGKVIDTTIPGHHKLPLPLVYSITFSGKGWFVDNYIKKVFTLVFFDTAGEDLDDEDTMSTVNKYIYRSDGIILLIDPLQLPTVRHQVSNKTALPEINTETSDILNRTTRLIEKGCELGPMDKLKTPLAIAFSKFDAILPLIDPQSQLRASANHKDGFDQDDFKAINDEIISLLDKWNGQDIIQLAQTRYAKYGFFGLSALGCNPHDIENIPHVLPRRVEDPFLWLLAQNGIIKKV
jgi:hypothetical protein